MHSLSTRAIPHLKLASFTPMKLSLPQTAHQLAQQFASEQLTPAAGKAIYLNTLAVHAVERYLKLLGTEADLNQGRWRNPIHQVLEDPADLVIPGIGTIECCPILPGDTHMSIPGLGIEDDTLGYVAVRFEDILENAELLGFMPVWAIRDRDCVPLTELQPLEKIFDYLTPAVKLWQPVEASRESVWQGLDAFVQTLSEQVRSILIPPALAFRSSNADARELGGMTRVKPIAIGMPLILRIDRMPLENSEQVQVAIKVCPLEDQVSIPDNLQLIVTSGETRLKPATRTVGNYVEKLLKGFPRERFQLQITLNDRTYSEFFEI